jgi:hypothetical protein
MAARGAVKVPGRWLFWGFENYDDFNLPTSRKGGCFRRLQQPAIATIAVITVTCVAERRIGAGRSCNGKPSFSNQTVAIAPAGLLGVLGSNPRKRCRSRSVPQCPRSARQVDLDRLQHIDDVTRPHVVE